MELFEQRLYTYCSVPYLQLTITFFDGIVLVCRKNMKYTIQYFPTAFKNLCFNAVTIPMDHTMAGGNFQRISGQN